MRYGIVRHSISLYDRYFYYSIFNLKLTPLYSNFDEFEFTDIKLLSQNIFNQDDGKHISTHKELNI